MSFIRFATVALPLFAGFAMLSGCQQQAGEQTQAVKATQTSDQPTDMEITDARLVLPAVKGNPGAAYLSIANQSSGTRVISSIAIDGTGRTEVHQTMGTAMNAVDRVEIAPATTMTFKPGNLHVMVYDVSSTMKPGDTTKITISFASGGNLAAPMQIIAAGDAAMGSAHEGMVH
ncbi:copper chaperone PCu(A)C [Novosphingobium sp.]|uniref:copper chaperone PCu(A)C n=1 Tax=Novosphingobium sp. TaxID=1874826 RepID=UPI0025DA7B20|nr:copper chaperone PCu(A)C [Novosphingobium sp.]